MTFWTGASQSAAGWLARLAKADRRELAGLAWSFAYFFLLLAAYYVLRPVRTELAVQTGVKNLPWLLTATFIATLAIQPVFGWLTATFPRARTLPLIYAFFALNLLGFYAAFGAGAQEPWLAKTFFVWLSVFNLFVVSVFWSFMADVFTADQGKRLFAVISAGGSLGALAGASIPAFAATLLGIDKLMLISALLLAACIVCIRGLRRWAATAASTSSQPSDGEEPLGGGLLAGIRQSFTSPYLGGISLYVLLWTYSGIALDLEVARVLGESIAAPLERTQLAARMEQAVSAISLAVQFFLTSRLIERLGLATALAFLPAVNLIGFLGLAFAPSLALLVVFDIARRAGEYAISKPAREVLFTVIDREAKYKAKNFIDTAVVRGGAVGSGWIVNGLKALGTTGVALAFTVIPVIVAWSVLALILARQQASLIDRSKTPRSEPAQ